MVDVSILIRSTLAVLGTQAEWIAKLKELVEKHGFGIVENWCDERGKHKHRLAHIAVKSNFMEGVKVMVFDLGFDPNVRRISDKCTPLHLAIWFKQKEMARLLI